MAATLPKAGGGTEDALCQSDLAPGAATGKIVACQRGVNGRIDKGRRVLQGGAVGMILYNAVKQDQESDNHYLPVIHIDGPSAPFTSFVTGHTNVMATWAQGASAAGQADMMASFSSRGPLGDWIKPDVTAPGVQVLAGTTPQPDQTTADNGPAGNLFMAIAGTSMSSPHSAGVSALVKAAHPTWTPSEIKSALMTSSVQTVVKEDGVTPATPFDMGAGSIRADRAVNPTLVFATTYAQFVAAGTDTLHRIDLNIPSIDATTMSGEVSTTRTARNVSGASQNMEVSISQPAGVTITVGNDNHDLHIAKDATVSIPVTISAPDVANGQYTARITLTPKKGGNAVTLPVAFVKTQGKVSLTHSCAPTSFAKNTGSSHCTVTAQNLGSTAANATLKVEQREKGKALRYKNVGAPGTVIGNGDGVQWSGPLSAALAPAITSISNDGIFNAYLPLAGFGGNLVIPAGDDTITNVNVPTFYFGGEPYSSIGVVSNGYVVIGGGTSADIVFNPQTFPVPARPNNVLAGVWSDLDPSAAGTIRVNVLTDGDADYLIVDYAGVKNFGNATTHTFEMWARTSAKNHTGPASELMWYDYGSGSTPGNAGSGDPDSGVNWGAENRDGSSGKNISPAPANGSEYTIHTAPPAPGGSVTIPFDVWGKKPGTYTSDASLTSDKTPGTTVVPQVLTINP